MTDVVVVGSANLDLVASCRVAPAPGETVFGTSTAEYPGGKGLNQAVAAAAFATTAFVGSVGDDRIGSDLINALTVHGVDSSRVTRSAVRSGQAHIVVASDGENSIVVVPGANSHLESSAAVMALERARPRVVACQLEVPAEVVAASAQWAASNGSRFIFNPSPIEPLLNREAGEKLRLAVESADPLIVNVSEARGLLAHWQLVADGDVTSLATLLGSVARSVIVTDGARGAHVATESTVHVPAILTVAIDTTGAGDAFAGTVAGRLALGDSLVDAVKEAVVVSSRLVQRERASR